MLWICDNIAVLTVAAVASLMAWLFGGSRTDCLIPVVPWVFVIMVDILFCFPQRHRGERQFEARARVWRELKRSPVFWTALGFLVILLIPFVNNGLCPGCDAALIAQGIRSQPPVPFLPFCVNRVDHLGTVFWFAVALLSAVGVFHCLTRRGKRLVLSLVVWNGTALAALGFLQNALGAPGPLWEKLSSEYLWGGDFFSTFGYVNMAADYFTLLFGVAVALWRDRSEQLYRESQELDSPSKAARGNRGIFWRANYYLIPAVVFFFAAINTLSRAAILFVSSLAVVFFVHTLVVVLSRMRRQRRVIVGVWSVMIFSLLIFFSTITMPERMRREVRSIGSSEVLDRVTGKAQYHATVATALWKEHRLFGCGGWGYRHLCAPQMRKLNIDTQQLQIYGGANVHNDYLQFLAEHGLVGFGALVAVALLLLWPVGLHWRDLVQGARFLLAKDLPPKPVQIFVLPAAVFILLCSVLTTVIHAFGDCPLRSCAVLTLFYVILASLTGFMPKREHETAPSGGSSDKGKDRHHSHHHHHHHHES